MAMCSSTDMLWGQWDPSMRTACFAMLRLVSLIWEPHSCVAVQIWATGCLWGEPQLHTL